MGWFSPKVKPTQAKATAKGVSKDKTRGITRRVEAPVSVKDKFYLKPLPVEFAWEMCEIGIYKMASRGTPDEEIARKTGMSLFDVRRVIAGPWYRQVDTQSDGRCTVALEGWNENAIPTGSWDDPTPWQNVYVSPAEIARHTGLVHDPARFIVRWDVGGFTYFSAAAVTNPKVPEYGNFFASRTPSVLKAYIAGLWEQVDRAAREKDEKALQEARKKAEKAVRDAAEYQRQIELLKKRR